MEEISPIKVGDYFVHLPTSQVGYIHDHYQEEWWETLHYGEDPNMRDGTQGFWDQVVHSEEVHKIRPRSYYTNPYEALQKYYSPNCYHKVPSPPRPFLPLLPPVVSMTSFDDDSHVSTIGIPITAPRTPSMDSIGDISALTFPEEEDLTDGVPPTASRHPIHPRVIGGVRVLKAVSCPYGAPQVPKEFLQQHGLARYTTLMKDGKRINRKQCGTSSHKRSVVCKCKTEFFCEGCGKAFCRDGQGASPRYCFFQHILEAYVAEHGDSLHPDWMEFYESWCEGQQEEKQK